MKTIIRSLRAYAVFTVVLGLAYPLLITLISQAVMPVRANGGLIVKNGTVVGARLIGQNFSSANYFQGRPSANNYDGANSGATNLGPSSKKLVDETAALIAKARSDDSLAPDAAVPADRVLSSASGLDPHISPANALGQLPRVAKARGISEDALKKLVSDHTDPDFIGLWGRPGVNVLELNLALDDLGTGSDHGR